MPSQFETMFATAGAPALQSVFGLVASYQATNGSPVVTVGDDGQPLMVRLHRNEVRQDPKPPRVAGEIQTGELIVQQSQLAKPAKGGRFAVEGVEVWTVETTPTLKNGQHYCTVSRTGIDGMMPRRAGT